MENKEIELYLKKFEEKYQHHEEYSDEKKAEDMAKCDGYKDYRIIKGYSCWHYFYNIDDRLISMIDFSIVEKTSKQRQGDKGNRLSSRKIGGKT